jgi:hypothetical protein
MMKTKLQLFSFLVSVIILTIPCQGQDGIPHQVDIPPSGPNVKPHAVPVFYVSRQYVVTVNGVEVPVFHAGLDVYFASFDFTGTVDVRVTAGAIMGARSTNEKYAGQVFNEWKGRIEGADFWLGNAQVRPLSKNIVSQTKGADVTFSISEPGQYTVERPGTSNYLDRVLFLFANPPEKDRPEPGDKNVIYLEAGLHHKNIDLSSGQTLYLEPGAVLFGAVNVWDAKNVNIKGRGTVLYYGPQSEDFDDNQVTFDYRANLKNWHPLTTRNTVGLNVEGVTFIDRSRSQMVVMYNTYDVVYDNIKLISVTPQNIIGDGFQLHHGERITFKNSLIRSSDDCFNLSSLKPMDKVDPEVVEGNYYVKNYLIENCVFWCTLANLFRVNAMVSDNIVMKNCDIIHFGRGRDSWAPWSIIHSISRTGGVKLTSSNFLIENVRFEEYLPFLGVNNSEAEFRNIVFKDITMTGTVIPWVVKSNVDGLTFDNVKVNGQLYEKPEDLPIEEGGVEIKNLTFK